VWHLPQRSCCTRTLVCCSCIDLLLSGVYSGLLVQVFPNLYTSCVMDATMWVARLIYLIGMKLFDRDLG
jgi:hypothetical protein